MLLTQETRSCITNDRSQKLASQNIASTSNQSASFNNFHISEYISSASSEGILGIPFDEILAWQNFVDSGSPTYKLRISIFKFVD